ncbi:MAG TPA: hypothetical protein VF845_04490 [Terriglobales bacterium]
MFNRGHLSFVATTLMLMAGTSLCRAQEATQAPAKSEVREAWRKDMVRTPLPKKGCFKASYPNKEWHEVPCSTAKPFPLRPQAKGNKGAGMPATVGGGGSTDFTAQSSALISTAEGSFNSVTPGISEASGPAGGTSGTEANAFSLQLNTNTFTNALTTSLCNGAAAPSLCHGWEQFVFQNNLPPPFCGSCVSIQYWLFPYGGATCPGGGPRTSAIAL